jgi:hypothetical protein
MPVNYSSMYPAAQFVCRPAVSQVSTGEWGVWPCMLHLLLAQLESSACGQTLPTMQPPNGGGLAGRLAAALMTACRHTLENESGTTGM